MEKETHILVFPFPLVGHTNPMLQFSKRLASKGLRVTFLSPISTSNFIQAKAKANFLTFETISEGVEKPKELESGDEHLERFKVIVSQSLANFIERKKSSKFPPKVLVYDSCMPWALDIARQHGLEGAPFFTQPCMVTAIYYHANEGAILSMPLELEGSRVSLPSMPSLEINDLPSIINDPGSYRAVLSLAMSQLLNVRQANCLLINTFDKLEYEVLKWMKSQWPIKTIGPTIPSMYIDKRLEDDKEYGLNLFKTNADFCMKWLDTKETSSVVYGSFGSLASLGEEQMEELSLGLID